MTRITTQGPHHPTGSGRAPGRPPAADPPGPRARALSPLVALLLPALVCAPLAAQQGPDHVYLTWRGNTSTTMTVNAQTRAAVAEVEVRYDVEPHRGDAGAYVMRATGTAHRIEGLADGRWVHWVDLTGLEPGRRYWFVVGSEEHGFSVERSFRTLPDDDSPVRFVQGGDLGLGPRVRALHAHAAAREPQFAVIGGDIAYVNGDLAEVADWDAWFDDWEATMVTPEGLTVPMVLAPGNHEVQGGYLGGAERAPFYTGFFAQPGRPSTFRLQFGELMSLYVLDTGHIVSHESQVAWLDETLGADPVPYRFASYHVPLYPSHRDYEGGSSVLGRTHWLPLFDRHGLTAGFENHDHTFKRTHLMKGDAVSDEGGTLYIGDGAWGRGERPVQFSGRPYLAASGANRHVWIVDVAPGGVEYRAVDERGGVFHVYPDTLPDAPAADAYFATLPQLYEMAEGTLSLEAGSAGGVRGADGSGDVGFAMTNRETLPVTVRFELAGPRVDAGTAVTPAEPVRLEPGASLEGRIAGEALAGVGFSVVQLIAEVRGEAPGPVREATLVETLGRDAVTGVPVVGADVGVPVLDGAVGEWRAWPWRVDGPAPGDTAPRAWSGPDDASAALAFAVDGDHLVVAARVRDDDVVAGGSGAWPDGDALALWLEPWPDGEFDDDIHFAIPLAAADGAAAVDSPDPGDWGHLAEAVEAWTARTSDGWSAEFRIPLAVLENAQSLRMNVGVADRDRGDARAVLLLRRPEWESAWDFDGTGVLRIRR